MRLLLETREVGRVTIVRCKGRIVAGGEIEALRAHVTHLLRDRRSIVLHLGEVVFIDSSGLGTIVRTLTSTRQVHGDLKLCDVPEHIRKMLRYPICTNYSTPTNRKIAPCEKIAWQPALLSQFSLP